MIPAAYDVHERVRAMDEDGVWAELLFPTFPRFGGTQFLQADDKELALAMVRAWNDWMLDEWCAAYPERFIPQTLIPLWDIPAAVARDRALRGQGLARLLFTENPHPLGLPSFPTGHWRPVFEACNAPECRCRCTSERRWASSDRRPRRRRRSASRCAASTR